jgi:hypothetical protein
LDTSSSSASIAALALADRPTAESSSSRCKCTSSMSKLYGEPLTGDTAELQLPQKKEKKTNVKTGKGVG